MIKLLKCLLLYILYYYKVVEIKNFFDDTTSDAKGNFDTVFAAIDGAKSSGGKAVSSHFFPLTLKHFNHQTFYMIYISSSIALGLSAAPPYLLLAIK